MITPEQTTAAAESEEATEVPVRVAVATPSMSLDTDRYADLRKAQEQDSRYHTILWKKKSETRPDWKIVAPHSPATKLCRIQWRSLYLREGVLHHLWETPAGGGVVWQLLLPKSMRRTAFLQLHTTPTLGHGYHKDPWPDKAMILMASLPTRCKKLVQKLWSVFLTARPTKETTSFHVPVQCWRTLWESGYGYSRPTTWIWIWQ